VAPCLQDKNLQLQLTQLGLFGGILWNAAKAPIHLSPVLPLTYRPSDDNFAACRRNT
jgi:hypothetical protein